MREGGVKKGLRERYSVDLGSSKSTKAGIGYSREGGREEGGREGGVKEGVRE